MITQEWLQQCNIEKQFAHHSVLPKLLRGSGEHPEKIIDRVNPKITLDVIDGQRRILSPHSQ